MVKDMKITLIFLLSVLFCSALYCQESLKDANSNIINTPVDLSASSENLKLAYATLASVGNYGEKKKILKIFNNNYADENVIDMTIDLLDHYYNKDNFLENDQDMYYDDVIAAELIKILGRSGAKKGFPPLLKIALNSSNHREDTVKEAWQAIEKIKW
jgi:hypothetical protein